MSLSPFTSLSTNNQLLNLIIHIIHPKPNNGMKTLTSITLLPMLLVACTSKQEFQPSGDPIRINQVGYYTKESKTAVIEEDGFCDTYQLKDLSTSQVVWEGKSVRTSTSPWSEKKHEVVDFSSVTKPGKYLLVAGNYSKQVNIEDHPYRALSVAALKAFYYQRSGEPIALPDTWTPPFWFTPAPSRRVVLPEQFSPLLAAGTMPATTTSTSSTPASPLARY